MLITISVAGILLLASLLVAARFEHQLGVWIAKPGLSLLFILVAWIQPVVFGGFQQLMIVGLILCFWGDVLLIPRTKLMFLLGLVAFLLGPSLASFQ